MSLRPCLWTLARAALCLATLAPAACDAGGGPRLRASWDGPKAGRLNVRAATAWCPDARRLEIEGIRQDLGVGVVVYAAESLQAGHYDVFDPGRYSMQRPGVAAALRWFNEQEVRGYQSDSGAAELVRDGPGWALSFGFRMVTVSQGDTIRLVGKVGGFTPGACPVDLVPEAADSE